MCNNLTEEAVMGAGRDVQTHATSRKPRAIKRKANESAEDASAVPAKRAAKPESSSKTATNCAADKTTNTARSKRTCSAKKQTSHRRPTATRKTTTTKKNKGIRVSNSESCQVCTCGGKDGTTVVVCSDGANGNATTVKTEGRKKQAGEDVSTKRSCSGVRVYKKKPATRRRKRCHCGRHLVYPSQVTRCAAAADRCHCGRHLHVAN